MDLERWQKLYSLWLDGQLSEAEAQQVETYLKEHPQQSFVKFNEALKNPPASPSPELWPMLKPRIGDKKITTKPFPWRRVAVAIIIIGISIGGYQYQTSWQNKLNKILKQNNQLQSRISKLESFRHTLEEERGNPEEILNKAVLYQGRGNNKRATYLFQLLRNQKRNKSLQALASYQLALIFYQRKEFKKLLEELQYFMTNHRRSPYLYSLFAITEQASRQISPDTPLFKELLVLVRRFENLTTVQTVSYFE